MSRPQFRCPASMLPHARKVLAGEYEVPGAPAPAHVLDIGANVGAFSVWAARTWPHAVIHAYEPHPDNVALLVANAAHALVTPAAVFAQGRLVLHEGLSNCGEHSLWRGAEQSDRTREVDGVSPSFLPPAQFVKLDTEGAELAILCGYRHLAGVQAIALETHGARDARAIRAVLEFDGLTLVSEEKWRADRSVQKWLRQS